jgi:anti-anti-sigma factor
MNSDTRVPFYNKIFFCDVIGYSKLSPVEQYSCQRSLNKILLHSLDELGLELEKDVVALPTGDGVALNFLMSEPDIHLRVAINTLKNLSEAEFSEQESPFGLRIGLNSHVDTLVQDINSKLNVVGSGINIAQRLMDLAKDRQILLHERVKADLEAYAQYASKLKSLGKYTVKHGKQVSVVQYVDPSCPFISSDPLPPQEDNPVELSLDAILKRDVRSNLLSITLDIRSRDHVDDLREYIEEFLDNNDGLQPLKVLIPWVASEMIMNAFNHGEVSDCDELLFRLRRSQNGNISVHLEQPDKPEFDLDYILSDEIRRDSFMQMISRAGLRWRVRRISKRLELSVEIPAAFQVRSVMPHSFPELGPAPDLPPEIAAFLSDIIDQCHHGCVLMIRPTAGTLQSSVISAGVQRSLLTQIQENPEVLALLMDLSRVSYVSSAGLRFLMTLSRKVRVCLIGVQPNIQEIFSIARFHQVVTIAPDPETGVRAALDTKPTAK